MTLSGRGDKDLAEVLRLTGMDQDPLEGLL